MVNVAHEEERGCYQVMRQHLGVVFSRGFEVNRADLLQPKGQLRQIIEFELGTHESPRPLLPHDVVRVGIGGIEIDKLRSIRNRKSGKAINEPFPCSKTPGNITRASPALQIASGSSVRLLKQQRRVAGYSR